MRKSCALTWPRGLVCGVALLTIAAPTHAQTLRLEASSLSTLGGYTQSETFSLRSSAGDASPSGQTQGGSFSMGSGLIGTLPVESSSLSADHTPPNVQALNEDVDIRADVHGAKGVQSATLFYKSGGEIAFTTVPMTAQGNHFSGTIPATAVTEKGLVYYIAIADRGGKTLRLPRSDTYAIRVEVPDPGISASLPTPEGSKQADYRIISIPLDLANRTASAVLADDLGPYDSTKWRLFELLPDEEISEYPEAGEMNPGKGFWVITREGGLSIDTGPGTSTDLQRPFGIRLQPGWNLIGTPFDFAVPVQNLRMKSGQGFALRSFAGNWNNPQTAPVVAMQPFEGYAVFNNRQAVDTLFVDPAVAASKAGKRSASAALWAIQITAESGNALDEDNVAAVAEGAAPDWDAFDQPEPPVIGEFVSAYFPHPEWDMVGARYAADVRAEPKEGDVWDFEVRANLGAPVHLQFTGLDRVPETYEVWLVDDMLQYTQDLRASAGYTLGRVGAGHPRSLQLIVGTTAFVDRKLEAIRDVPHTYEVFPNFPNPFRSSTTIRYGLPQDASVTLKVYNGLGQEVATLVRGEELEAGIHVTVWDGRGMGGEPLASGVYFVRLEAEGHAATRPMVIVR
ncbi:MAG TPA: FlgD immunoglobulin-like domain containing protein [Rhodothermales bacterium]|nr:FlgD immunoglobulin-like domain containing protein [Rhodothermales bacterium]